MKKDRYKLRIGKCGEKHYYKRIALHREDGPAHVFPSMIFFGTVNLHYYIDGYYMNTALIA